MQIDRTFHAQFFEKELLALEASYQEYLNATALSLLESRQLFRAQVVRQDSSRGNLILKFPKGRAPRLQEHLGAFTVTDNVKNKNIWGQISYFQLRAAANEGTNLTSIFYMPEEDSSFVQMGFANAELSFLQKITPGTLLILGHEEPPFEYLANLKELVQTTPPDSPAGKLLDFNFHAFHWKPTSVTSSELVDAALLHLLKQETVLVQGPPGTGKTYFLATICAKYLELGATVLVISMANRALIELVEKEALAPWLDRKKIKKTNLNQTEQKKVGQLQPWDVFDNIEQNALHLTTFYKASTLATRPGERYKFDLVIVEEASQAFLATLAMARVLATKMLVVGDPQQLRPTVLQKLDHDPDSLSSNLIDGFEAIAQQHASNGYRLIETHRLSPKACIQTGVFYDNQLQSVSSFSPLTGSHPYAELFDPAGGTSIWYTNDCDHKSSIKSAQIIFQIVSNFQQYHPSLSFAVLTAYRESAKHLQEYLFPRFKKTDWLTVETVDRIQGMTCDLCIFLIPHAATSFSIDLNRFNVATSRARLGTLILSHPNNRLAFHTNPIIKTYLDACLEVKLSSTSVHPT